MAAAALVAAALVAVHAKGEEEDERMRREGENRTMHEEEDESGSRSDILAYATRHNPALDLFLLLFHLEARSTRQAVEARAAVVPLSID